MRLGVGRGGRGVRRRYRGVRRRYRGWGVARRCKGEGAWMQWGASVDARGCSHIIVPTDATDRPGVHREVFCPKGIKLI